MTKREFWLVAFLGVLLIGAGSIMFGIKPFLDQMSEDTAAASNASMRQNLLRLDLDALTADNQRLDELREEVAAFTEFAPSARNEEVVVHALQSLAAEHELSSWRAEFGEAETLSDGGAPGQAGSYGSLQAGINRIPFVLNLSGNFSEMLDLSEDLQGLARGLNLSSIQLVPASSGSSTVTEERNYRMTISGFMYSFVPQSNN